MAEWKQLSGEIGLAPDFIKEIKPSIDAIFQTINVTLDLLQSILSFVKNFLIDFTQPIKLIIDALVAQLKALLLDIKQMGIYWTSDADLIPQIKKDGIEPFSDGYAGFQNRMVGKLTNVDDPSRPNFSTATGTISLFVFASADFNGIINAINSILKFIELFTKKKEDTPDPDPVNIKGVLKKGLFPIDLKRESEFDGVNISWDIAPPPNASGKPFPSFVNPPKSFLIHVRTRPNALYIGYKYRPNNSTETDQVQTSIYYLTKNTLVQVNGGTNIYTGIDSNTIFLESPTSDIEYSVFDIVDTGYTFYYSPSTIGSFIAGNTYTLSLTKDQIPNTYEYKYKNGTDNKKTVESAIKVPTTKLYVEVVSCDTDLGLNNGDAVVPGQITLPKGSEPNIQVQTSIRTTPIRVNGVINLPLPETSKYISALKDALAIYLLGGYYKDTSMGLSAKTQTNIKAYLNKLPTDTELLTDVDFKNQVDAKIGVIVNKMNMPDQSIIKSLEKDINNLTKPYLKDPTNPSNKITFYNLVGDFGVSSYIPGVTYDKNSIKGVLRSVNKLELNKNIPENLPVLYSADSQVKAYDFASTQTAKITKAESVRATIEKTKGGEDILVLNSAKNFLEFLPRRKPVISGEGAWENIRFFEDGIPEFEQFMKLIIGFLESLSFGLDGIIKAIKQYIDLIILRIEEIQALINKIKAIIDYLLGIKIGGNVALLYSVNDGTRGIVENLINSESKPPFTDSETLGFGACFVFGGYPAFLPALLKAFSG